MYIFIEREMYIGTICVYRNVNIQIYIYIQEAWRVPSTQAPSQDLSAAGPFLIGLNGLLGLFASFGWLGLLDSLASLALHALLAWLAWLCLPWSACSGLLACLVLGLLDLLCLFGLWLVCFSWLALGFSGLL